MRLDEKQIEAKIAFIKQNLEFAEQLSRYSLAEFEQDRRNFYSAVHALQISIDAMLDVLSHIIARLHLGAPTNDRETLEIALKHRLISSDHFQRFFEMNKFRNKVVHGYLDVDAKKVYAMLTTELGDFQLFFDDVRQVIEQERAKENNHRKKKTHAKP